MITDYDEVIQAITSIMSGSEVDQTQVGKDQFKIEDEHEMIEVEEAGIENGTDTFPEVQFCDGDADLDPASQGRVSSNKPDINHISQRSKA